MKCIKFSEGVIVIEKKKVIVTTFAGTVIIRVTGVKDIEIQGSPILNVSECKF